MESVQMWIVAVYLVERLWGGPEEGGWWFDTGELVRPVKMFRSEDRAYAYSRRLNERLESRCIGPNAGRRELSSVLSDGEYSARVYAQSAPQAFPESTPRYE